jgi:hypothetical protein
VGEWVLLDVRTRVEPAGVGVAASTLYDGRGSIGLVAQSLYVAERHEAAGDHAGRVEARAAG